MLILGIPLVRLLPMQIERVVRRLYGKPCWGVSPGFGSFLTLEFGEPHLEVREPVAMKKGTSAGVRKNLIRRAVYIHGDWHLWIYCCDWQVFSGTKHIGDLHTSTWESRWPDPAGNVKFVTICNLDRGALVEFDRELAVGTDRHFG